MINHGRNLLLNANGSSFVRDDVPGEEYVPPDFRSVRLPTSLQRVRSVLFGDRPDRLMLNYRTRELLQLLHATELREFLTDLDPRITYEFGSDFADMGTGLVVTQLEGSSQIKLDVIGDLGSAYGQNNLYREWNLDVIDTDTIEVSQVKPTRSVEEVEYDPGTTRSSAIALPGSGLSVKFNTGHYVSVDADLSGTGYTDAAFFDPGLFNVSVSGTFSGTVSLERSFDEGATWELAEDYGAETEHNVVVADNTVYWRIGFAPGDYTSGTATVRLSQITTPNQVGCRWNVKLHSKPTNGLGDILIASRGINEESQAALFGSAMPSTTGEPYGTFFRLWRNHHELPYALGGLVLALIYRTEGLRNA